MNSDDILVACDTCGDKMLVDCPTCDGSCVIRKTQGRKVVEKPCTRCAEISGKIDCPDCSTTISRKC